jgi:hypothetical protein
LASSGFAHANEVKSQATAAFFHPQDVLRPPRLIFPRLNAWKFGQWLHEGTDSTHPIVEYGEERSVGVVVHEYDLPNPGVDIDAPAVVVIHERPNVKSIAHTKWRLRI